MKCDYEGCKTMGCAQERILGLGPCRGSPEDRQERRIGAVISLAAILLLIALALLK